jgi:hypothetical protein
MPERLFFLLAIRSGDVLVCRKAGQWPSGSMGCPALLGLKGGG